MPVLVEHYVVVGDQAEANASAELWRFGPKSFKSYYNIPHPALIQRRAEAEIPLDRLAAARFPKLVISGAHHPAFDAVCDVLEQRLPAERAVLPGAGHSLARAPGYAWQFMPFGSVGAIASRKYGCEMPVHCTEPPLRFGSCISATFRTAALISSVMCGMTWIVFPR